MARPIARLTSLAAALAILAGCTSARPPHEPPPIAFIGIAVVSMQGPPTVAADQTVVLRGDRIVAVGARQSVHVPAGAVRVDGSGRFLMPGLVDAHVHLEHFDDPGVLALFLAHGITTLRNMDGRPYILDWRERVQSGAIAGPRIVTAGPILDGAPPLLPDNTAVPSTDAARRLVSEQAALGYDFVKVYTNLSAEVYEAIAAEARAKGLPVAGHVPRSVPLQRALEWQQAFEHLNDLGRAIEAGDSPHLGRWHWSKALVAAPIDGQKLENVARQIAAAGTPVVPTLVQAARSVASGEQLEAWQRAAEAGLVSAEMREAWVQRVRRASERLEGDDWRVVERGVEQRRAIVRALRAANVPVLAGTDTPNPFVVPGVSLHEELRLLEEAGLSRAEVLIAATRAPCEFLRLACGVIEAGRAADLIVTATNPLEAGAAIEPITVVAAGRMFDPRHGAR
jgi:imidazolonepropionase-like amidohydrolase